jgi:hypothetical protein
VRHMCRSCLDTQKADPLTIIVRERAGVDLTDYPVRIQLENLGFTDWANLTPESIYFTDENGNPLYFWIEELDTVNRKSIIWVKIPSLQANSQITIYMHYGGENQYTQYHDPTKVFILFDNFDALDTTKWTLIGSPTVVDGALRLTPGNIVMTAQAMPKNIRVRIKLKFASFGVNGARLAIQIRSNSARTTMYDYMIEQRPGSLKCTIRRFIGGSVTDLNWITTTPLYSIDTWYKDDCRAYETMLSWLVCDGLATVTATDSQILTDGHVVLDTWDAGNDVRVDWVAIAPFVDPEPEVSLATPPAPPPTIPQPTYPISDSLVIETGVVTPPPPPPEQPQPAPPRLKKKLEIPWWLIIIIIILLLIARKREEKL